MAEAPDKVTGKDYADSIARYLRQNYGNRGIEVYREVSMGKTIIGKNRRIDILAIHTESAVALAIECKYQGSAGTTDEKIPYTLQDLEVLPLAACVAYAGTGWSDGVLHMLRGSPMAAYCLPGSDLRPGPETSDLDHIVAMTFKWWDVILRDKPPFR